MPGGNETFIEFYSKNYNIQINDVNQPILFHTLDNQSKVYIVPELVRMSGLTDRMKNNFKVLKEVSKFTCLPPE